MYELLGICVALAALLVLNAGASMASAVFWRLFAPVMRQISARTRADVLFTMRLAAPTLAAIIVGFFLIPSYLSYEPRSTSEIVSKKLAALAMLSLGAVAFAFWRTIRTSLATRNLRNDWLARSERIELPGVTIPAFRVAHRFPIIAVVGSVRPRLFIASDVLDSLSEEELAAAIAHECGHLKARDNLKRTVLRLCRDSLLLAPLGRTVERAWAETAESAADEFAAANGPAMALNLASALVTIVKMIPTGARADVPLAAYLVGAEDQGVKVRIRRLIEMASTDQRHRSRASFMPLVPMISTAAFLVFGVAVAGNAKVLLAVHGIIERAVDLLC